MSKDDGMQVNPPQVYIAEMAKEKLDFYLDSVPGEISGLGIVENPYGNVLHVTDVFIFEQECSSGGTELDAVGLGLGIAELVSREDLDPEKLKLWWHSHGNGSVFFSSTDTDTRENTFSGAPWFLAIVGNKKGEYRVAVDWHQPWYHYLDNIGYTVGNPPDPTIEPEPKVEAPKLKKCKYKACDIEYDKVFETVSSNGGKNTWQKDITPDYCVKHTEIAEAIKAEVDAKVSQAVVTTYHQGKVLSPSGRGKGSENDSYWDGGFAPFGYMGHMEGSRPESFGDDNEHFKNTKFCIRGVTTCRRRIPKNSETSICPECAEKKKMETDTVFCPSTTCSRILMKNSDKLWCDAHEELAKRITKLGEEAGYTAQPEAIAEVMEIFWDLPSQYTVADMFKSIYEMGDGTVTYDVDKDGKTEKDSGQIDLDEWKEGMSVDEFLRNQGIDPELADQIVAVKLPTFKGDDDLTLAEFLDAEILDSEGEEQPASQNSGKE